MASHRQPPCVVAAAAAVAAAASAVVPDAPLNRARAQESVAVATSWALAQKRAALAAAASHWIAAERYRTASVAAVSAEAVASVATVLARLLAAEVAGATVRLQEAAWFDRFAARPQTAAAVLG